MIPEDILSSIKSLEMSAVIGKHIHGGLKKRGNTHIGLCPFHDEKTPSFNVRDHAGIYKCFGCGKGGDVIKFYMEHDQLTFPEAVQQICEENNIDYRKDEKAEPTLKDKIIAASILANNEYHKSVTDEKAQSYLVGRGITQEAIEQFQIGYADNQFQGMTNLLTRKYSVEQDTLLACGISKQGDENVVYDTYRSRIVFPIHNYLGRVIGFSARATLENQKPKYINSVNSDAFNKSSELYGLHIAKKHISEADMVYVVEGATDVISMHTKSGIHNTVGTLGTALTPEHCRKLLRYTKNICLIYDGDTAGLKAMFKACEPIMKAGMMVYISCLPPGEDPDSFCTEHLADAKKLIEQGTKDIISFRMTLLGESIKDKIRLAQELKRMISMCPDPIVRQVLEADYMTKFLGKHPTKYQPVKKERLQESHDYEEHLIRCMLLYRSEFDVYATIDEEYADFLSESFMDEGHRAIFAYLCSNRAMSFSEIIHADTEFCPAVNSIVDKGGITSLKPQDDWKISLLYVEEAAWKHFNRQLVLGESKMVGDPRVMQAHCKTELIKIEADKQALIKKINGYNKP